MSRPTEDLDFFTARHRGDVAVASDSLVSAAEGRGWSVELLRSGPDFRRWSVTGPETVLVDLAVDSPAAVAPTVTLAGPAFAPADLAVRKTLALFGRAEPRDFIDVYMLNQQFDRDETLELARAADLGFDLTVFVQALPSHARVDDQDFPDVGVALGAIRAYFDSWALALEDRIEETRTDVT